jgi:hypothetical protein
MTPKLVTLDKTPNKQVALEVIESLRLAIENGEIVAFAAVGIEEDDCTRMWSSSTRPVTRLRMMGAMYNLLHTFNDDE